MKPLLCFVFALFLFIAQTKTTEKALNNHFLETKSTSTGGIIENIQIVESNSLYHDLFEFGMKKLLEKNQTSDKLKFNEKPEYKMISVRTLSGPGLRVAFTAEIKDENGGEHEVILTVAYQSWKSLMILEEGSVNGNAIEKSE